jgi:hypothetical protein
MPSGTHNGIGWLHSWQPLQLLHLIVLMWYWGMGAIIITPLWPVHLVRETLAPSTEEAN